jgi:hypothetical protein
MTINPSQVSSIMTVKAGDTLRVSYDTLQLGGQYINLVFSSVFLIIHDPVTNTTVSRSATITDAVSGSVQYQLTSDDIGTAGSKLAEWKVVTQDNKVLYVPSDSYILWNIVTNLETQ